jgi:hypothetical protein
MKTETETEIYDYAPAYKVKYQWVLIAIMSSIFISFSSGYLLAVVTGDKEIAINMAIILGFITLIWGVVIGIKKMLVLWPNEEPKGFWSIVKIGLFNTTVLGYRNLPIGRLPWKVILTWGITMTAALTLYTNGDLVLLLMFEEYGAFSILLGLAMGVFPIQIVFEWGLGKIIRWLVPLQPSKIKEANG